MKKTLYLFVIVMAVVFYWSGIAKAEAGYSLTYTPPVWYGLPVIVNNPDSQPVPVNVVNSAVSEPMQHDLASDAFIVPTDRLLIIKYVSGNCYMTAGYQILKFFIGTGPAENRMRNHFVPVFMGNHSGDDNFSFSQQTYIYAPPGSTVNYGWATSNPTLHIFDLVISGDLVPIL